MDKASEILGWLLRAWAANDSVLKFISLFTPLESVIPKIPRESKEFAKNKNKLLHIIKENCKDQDQKSLTKLVKELQASPPSLAKRFENWASNAALKGWENDIKAFNRFSRMRNVLLHQAHAEVEFKVVVTPKDVLTLEDIAERYISLALFANANIYRS
jgi:hypothetical protein